MTTTPTKTGRKRKPPPLVRFDTPTDLPPMAAAATLAVGVLKWTRVNSLDEFWEHATDSALNEKFQVQLGCLDLTEAQQDLLRAYDPILRLIRVKPAVTIAVCPVCCTREVHGTDGPTAFHGWQAIVGQAPTKCRVTAGCDGKPVKARTPVQVKIDRDENGDPVEPGAVPAVVADDPDPGLFEFETTPAQTDPNADLDAELARAVEAAVVETVTATVHQTPEQGASEDFADDFDFIETTADPTDLTDFDFD